MTRRLLRVALTAVTLVSILTLVLPIIARDASDSLSPPVVGADTRVGPLRERPSGSPDVRASTRTPAGAGRHAGRPRRDIGRLLQPALSLADYRALVEATLDDLRGPSPNPEQIVHQLDALGPVRLPDGSTLQPSLGPVIDDLRRAPPDIDSAAARLEAVLAALEATAAGTAATGDPQAQLRDVLARPEFQPEETDDDRSLVARVRGWLGDQLRRVLGPLFDWLTDRTGDDSASARVFDLVLMVLALAMIGGLVVWVVRTVRRQMTPAVVAVSDAEREARMSSLEGRAEAERLFQEGRYRAALRALYLATLVRWEEAGRLHFDRSLTNREVLRDAERKGDAALIEQLSPMVERFDRIWYGDLDCTADDYRSFSQLAARAWEAAP